MSSKLTLNHIVGMIQSEELQRRSMGLSKEDTSDVHNCGETTTVGEDQSCTTEKQGHTRSKFTDRNPNSFCTYCKTCHVMSHQEWFTSYSQSAGSICMGNTYKCMISGVRNIPLWLPNGSTIILQQVQYITELKWSPISIGT